MRWPGGENIIPPSCEIWLEVLARTRAKYSAKATSPSTRPPTGRLEGHGRPLVRAGRHGHVGLNNQGNGARTPRVQQVGYVWRPAERHAHSLVIGSGAVQELGVWGACFGMRFRWGQLLPSGTAFAPMCGRGRPICRIGDSQSGCGHCHGPIRGCPADLGHSMYEIDPRRPISPTRRCIWTAS